MTAETLSFQTEVGKILKIVANSLYSDRQIFLRELISNASDACDRLRYLAITEPTLIADDTEFRVELSVQKKAKLLTISDNGIGMNREALIDDLGTIARSGSSAFIDALSNEKEDDVVQGFRGFNFPWLLCAKCNQENKTNHEKEESGFNLR